MSDKKKIEIKPFIKSDENGLRIGVDITHNNNDIEASVGGEYNIHSKDNEAHGRLGVTNLGGVELKRQKREDRIKKTLGLYTNKGFEKIINKYVNYSSVAMGLLIGVESYLNILSQDNISLEYKALEAVVAGIISAGVFKLGVNYLIKKVKNSLQIRF